MSARTLFFRRLLAAPGREAALRDAVVEVADGRIRSVRSELDGGGGDGPGGEDGGASAGRPERDGEGRGRDRGGEGGREDLVAMPALVNAHDHGYGLRPLALGGADDALECWIASLTSRPTIDPRLEAAVAFGRMARSGIGATVHCHNSLAVDRLPEEAAGVARAAADVGLRVAFSCPILDRNAFAYGDQGALLPHLDPVDQARLTDAMSRTGPAVHQVDQVEAIAGAFESERFRVQYGPIGPQWCQDATLERIARASADHDRRVHMHLLESRRQREWLDFAYRRRGGILRHLDDIGLLSPRLTVAHGVQVTEPECELLAERGVTVAVNTSSNLRLRSGVAPLARFVARGVRFGFGLDGGAHDDDQDYLRDLRLTWRLHGGTGLVPALPLDRLFEAALRNGARAVDGSTDYGAVAPGARADLAALDYAAMTADFVAGGQDEADVLLTRATAGHVRWLVVDGHDVVRGGRLVGPDLDEMEAELITRARREAGISPEQSARDRRRREAARRYYVENRHLAARSSPNGEP